MARCSWPATIRRTSRRPHSWWTAASRAPTSLLSSRRRNQPNVAARHHHELALLNLVRVVQRRHRRILDREELAVALVHEVGQPAAVALAGQREVALDPPAVCLEND